MDLEDLLAECLPRSSQTLRGSLCHCADIDVLSVPLFRPYRTREYFYEFAMAYRVKETFQVKVYNITVVFADYFLCRTQCTMATTFWTEAETVLVELLLIDGD